MHDDRRARLENLSPAKRALLERWRRGQAQAERIPLRSGGGPVPLSFAQQRLWFLSRLHPDSAHYHMPAVFRIAGPLDAGALERSLREIVRRHQALRTRFFVHEGRPLQAVVECDFRLERRDVSAVPSATRDDAVAASVRDEVSRPFDLAAGQLLHALLVHTGHEDHTLVLTLHHIACDAWSAGILGRELTALYDCFAHGRPSTLPELPVQYPDVSVWQRERLSGDRLEEHLRYWRDHLVGPDVPMDLAVDHPRPEESSFLGAEQRFSLSTDTTQALQRLCLQEGTTLFAGLLAAYYALLFHYTGQHRLVVGIPVAGRLQAEVDGLIGFFANTLPLRIDIDPELGYRSLLGQAGEVVRGAFAHQEVPFDMIVEELQPERTIGRNPLFQTMLALQPHSGSTAQLGQALMSKVHQDSRVVRMEVELHLWELDGALHASLMYARELFDERRMAAMAAAFAALVEQAAHAPDTRIADLPLMAAGGLARMPQPHIAIPALAPAPMSVEECGHRAPDALAVAAGDTALTYAALRHGADRVAAALIRADVRRGSHVGVIARPRAELLCDVLGIWRAGCAVVVLPADADREQRRVIATTTRLQGLLISDVETEEGTELGVRMSPRPAESGPAPAELPAAPTLAETAVVMVGSDGSAVSLDHRELARHIRILCEVAALAPGAAVAPLLPAESPGFVAQLVFPLVVGGHAVLLDRDATSLRALAASNVTVAVATAGWLARRAAEDRGPAPSPSHLQMVLTCGEPLPDALVAAMAGQVRADVRHLQGLSETLPFATVRPVGAGSTGSGAGHVVPGLQMSIRTGRDGGGRALPIGLVGEVWFAWDSASEEPSGARGTRLPDGSIAIAQARAGACWIDGALVAPRLAEARLLEHSQVMDCAVLPRATPDGVRLVAYVVLDAGLQIRQLPALVTHLPAAARPDVYIPVPAIPMTPSGAIDAGLLERMPVLDADAVARCERQLRGSSGVRDAAVRLVRVEDELGRTPLAEVCGDAPPRHLGSARRAQPEQGSAPASPELAPALCHGRPLDMPADALRTLAEALARAARGDAGRGIRYWTAEGEQRFESYAALDARARRVTGGLQRSGLAPGALVLLQLEDGWEFFAAFWGCVLGGLVPVPLSPVWSQPGNAARLASVWQFLEAPAVVTSRAGEAAVRDVARAHGLALAPMIVEELLAAEPGALHADTSSDDLALLLLTSGSTGLPKAVTQTHRALLCRSHAHAQYDALSADDVFFNWMPLDHVGGLVMMSLQAVHLGATLIQIPMRTILGQPLLWLDGLAQTRATVSWAPNFAFGLINDHADEIRDRRWELGAVRRLQNGGEAVVARTAHRFLELLEPHGLRPDAMCPVWGMSETGSGATYEHAFTRATTRPDQPHVSVGEPIPGFSVRIVDEGGELLREGQIGQLEVRGVMVTRGYLRNEEQTRASFSADGWFRTGDLALLQDGKLTITGRAKDVIIINGANYAAHEIESIIEELPEVQPSFTAACAVRSPGSQTDELAVFFVPRPPSQPWEHVARVRDHVVARAGVNPRHVLPLSEAEVPKTEIGKIARARLKQLLESGAFDELQQRLLSHGETDTVPDWFFRPVWRRRAAAAPRPLREGAWLIFADAHGLGARLAREVPGAILVEAEVGFAQRAPDRFAVRPGYRPDIDAVIDAVARTHDRVAGLVHLWTYGPSSGGAPDVHGLEASLERSIYTLLHALQCLSARGLVDGIEVVAASSHVQAVAPGDVVAPERAPLAGWLRAIPGDWPSVRAAHVDLPGADPERDAELLLADLASASRDAEIAHRAGKRLVLGLAPLSLAEAARTPTLLRRGGTYLVTGGLGGLGRLLAEDLAGSFDARLVLVGRSSELDREQRDWLAALGAGRAVHIAGDVADPGRLGPAVQRAVEGLGGRLDGIFHLAGAWRDCAIADESVDGTRAVLAGKAHGACALHRLEALAPDGFIVHFSSVNGIFGGPGVAAYAAANRFLEHLVHEQRRAGRRSYCVSWSLWDEIGMSRGLLARQASRARGFMGIPRWEGLASLRIALQVQAPVVLVGLDRRKPMIRRLLDGAPRPLHSLEGYVVADTPAAHARTELVRDRHGRLAEARIEPLDRIPRHASGAADWVALDAERQQGGPRVRRIELRTAVEERIADIWSELLGDDRPGATDNFFELGGHSLLATQLASRLAAAFEVGIDVKDVFVAPTVSQLARFVEERSSTPQRPPLVRRHEVGDAPLSFSQQRLWFVHQLSGGSSAYNIPIALRLRGRLDRAALVRALDGVVARHAPLRTTFVVVDGQPVQRIHDQVRLELTSVALPAAEDHGEQLQRLLREEALTPFDLASGPPMRARMVELSSDDQVLLLSIHHIAADGWSIGILVRELAELYRGFARGASATLPPLAVEYADFARWQRAWLDGQVLAAGLDYWRARLRGAPEVLELPTDRRRPPVMTMRGQRIMRVFPSALSQRVQRVAREHNATPFMALFSAWLALLSRYSGQTDLVVGTPLANRTRRETEPLLGLFVNTLPVRVDLAGEPSTTALIDRVREAVIDVQRHQEMPFEAIVETLAPQRSLSHTPVFQVAFSLQSAAVTDLDMPGVEVALLAPDSPTAKFDLTLSCYEMPEGLLAALEYSTDLFEAQSAERMLTQLERLLDGMTADPAGSVSRISLLDEDGRRAITHRLSGEQGQVAQRDRSIAELFLEQVQHHASAVAVECGAHRVTYAELDARSTALAGHLVALGVRRGDRLGVCIERSVERIAALVAIVKAGAAYVPLDPAYPFPRLAFLLDDTGTSLILTQASLVPRVAELGRQMVVVDGDWGSRAADFAGHLPVGVDGDDLLYIVYTSGSTGTPKGVCVPHRGVLRLVREACYVDLSPAQTLIHISPLDFDASTFEIWGALLNGARLVVMPPGTPSLRELGDVLVGQGVTTMFMTTAWFHRMVADEIEGLRGLGQLLAGGEIMSPVHARTFVDKFPRCYFANVYGPTENTTFSTWFPINEPPPLDRAIPIGRPIHGTSAYVLDEHGELVPVGVPGELYLGGDGVALGYLKRDELSRQRFVPDRFGAGGGLLYRTGDRVRFLEDGNVEFLGRFDHQVKIRGHRIEPGEIERALLLQPGVRQCLVMTREEPQHGKRLIAFVAHEQAEQETGMTLRQGLLGHLPEYMVPSLFVVLPELPLTDNAKIDRVALAAMPVEAVGPALVPPADELEARLAAELAAALDLAEVGVTSDFFLLGGHSLTAMHLINKIRQGFGVDIPLRDFFADPTVRGLAALVKARTGEPSSAPHARQRGALELKDLLDEIDGLSEEEAASRSRGEER